MSEEEKKAIEYFYNLRATIDVSNMMFDKDINVKCGKETIRQITIILNLINKLQKENERLKTKIDICNCQEKSCIEIIESKYISKEKVKDKLKKLEIEKEKAKGIKDNLVERYTIENKINILQEILKEGVE